MQHISSRQALQELTTKLVGDGSTLSDAELRTIGSDLLAVAGVLRGQPALRRTLSEATTSTENRTDLIGGLLDGKVHPAVVAVTKDAVGRSWASGADLRDGVERLGRTALFLGAERAGELDEVEDQLFRFGRIVDGNPELSVLLNDPTADPQGRTALISRLLDGRANPLAVELLAGLAANTGGRSFSHGVRELVDQAADRKNMVVARVQTAAELDDAQRSRLSAALQRSYGRPIGLHIELDPELAGGLRITVGDEVIDGSVAGRMSALRRRMAG
jgi:F-type H+-transporting ATPase subunit delta